MSLTVVVDDVSVVGGGVVELSVVAGGVESTVVVGTMEPVVVVLVIEPSVVVVVVVVVSGSGVAVTQSAPLKNTIEQNSKTNGSRMVGCSC